MRASMGGTGSDVLLWRDLVLMLQSAMSAVYSTALTLISLFMTPFGEIIENDTGLSEIFIEIVAWIFNVVGLDLLSLTPLEFMLGSALPFIILFTVYRYIKQ